MTDEEFEDLFRAVYPRLVAMGLAMSAERGVAQDLAQETMVRAHRHRDELSGYDAPVAWCRRVMGNLLIDHHRSRAAERSAVERVRARVGVAAGDDRDDPASLAASRRWSDIVARLTPQQRLVATLYYAEDQSVDRIAAALGVATGTVQSALSKARANLRSAYDAAPTTGDDEEARS